MAYFILMILLLLIGWNLDMKNTLVTQLIREALIFAFVCIAYIGERKNLRISKY
jgi:hypothetical protein